MYRSIEELNRDLIECSLCPRLARYRVEVAGSNPRYRGERYWSKPVPGYGPVDARIVVVGLAPAPHGGNRTGRVFTGDYTATNLMKALHQVGLANKPYSRSREDGLELCGTYLTAALKCAPPDNRPLASELRNCFRYISQEIALLRNARVYVALGRVAWDTLIRVFRQGLSIDIPTRSFSHGKVLEISLQDGGKRYLVASYHPSPRNMWTGTLTHDMLVSVFRKAIELAGFTPRCFSGASGSGRGDP